MDKTQRASLLRERFKATGGIAYASRLKIQPRHYRPKPRGWFNWPTNFEAFGEIAKDNSAKWIEKPNPKPISHVKIKRGKRVDPLVQIAKKSGKKLRKGFVSADDYLASRAQQSRP